MARPRTLKPRSEVLGALGRAIERVIAENGITHEGIADTSEMDVKQVGSFIRGQGNPTYETLRRLCKGLPVTLGELVTLAEKLEEGQEPDGQALSSDV